TVANAPRADLHWQGSFAKAVSLAACGRHEEAVAVALSLKNMPTSRRPAIAKALAPYAPSLALSLLKDTSTPVELRVALLLRLGNRSEALDLLRTVASVDTVSNKEG